MEIDALLNRREMVELALRAAALPGAGGFFAGWLRAGQNHNHAANSAAPPEPPLLRDYQPKFFSPKDFRALQAFTEILIPTDEAPGAREAYCAHFIDFVLQASDELPHVQDEWRQAMELLKEVGFYSAEPARRLQLVREMSAPETHKEVKHPAFPAYRLIKQQTTFAFYTSRAGMIDALDYKGNSYNSVFPACNHPEHQTV